ncbi:MAG: NEW3 domain-containing protein, partial [Armatimonadetes bacterium]|nr:NEW3 domain-containing protein [Armatimonadota bacterium]
VVAMTPVDLTAAYTTAKGKQRIIVAITNSCDLPVRGVVGLRLPKGWKADTKSLKSIALASGKTFRQGVDLTPPVPGAALPEHVKVSAELTVEKEPYLAKFTLTATAGGAKN